MKKRLRVNTEGKTGIDNVTRLIDDAVTGIESCLLHISIPHTTAALFLAEDDAKLREDFIKIATDALASLRPFKHIRKNNPNTEAHAISSIFGTTLSIVVEDGKLQLGTYQNIMLLEMDGPKERQIDIRTFAFGT